eukprot:6233546-Amphidinium_carterae.1
MDVQWIGARLLSNEDNVTVAIPTKKTEEIKTLLRDILSKPVCSRKVLLSLVGKISFVAGL